MMITRQTSFSDLPEFITPEEYRAFMGLSRAAAYEHIQAGKVPAVRFGKLLRIPKAAIVAMVNEAQEACA